MAFHSISFHGYQIKGEDIFIIAPVREVLEKDNGVPHKRQIVLPLYAKQHASPYSLVLLEQHIDNPITAEQEEEWRVTWQYRKAAFQQLVEHWENSY